MKKGYLVWVLGVIFLSSVTLTVTSCKQVNTEESTEVCTDSTCVDSVSVDTTAVDTTKVDTTQVK